MVGCLLFFVACDKTNEIDSVPQQASIPFIAYSNLNSPYIYGEGNSSLFTDLPTVLGVAVDTIYGFVGGYGGKTGMDSIQILKSELAGFGDTINAGSSSFSVSKFNKGGYKVVLRGDVVIAAPNNNPGPTSFVGTFKRTSNGYLLNIGTVGPGIYLLYNPGGAAAVGPNPYLLYNYKDVNGNDSLSFKVQTDLCGGGLMLVNPAAPSGLTAAEYEAQHRPAIASMAPLTLQWRVYEFPSATDAAVHPGAALCNWGLGIRTFEIGRAHV